MTCHPPLFSTGPARICFGADHVRTPASQHLQGKQTYNPPSFTHLVMLAAGMPGPNNDPYPAHSSPTSSHHHHHTSASPRSTYSGYRASHTSQMLSNAILTTPPSQVVSRPQQLVHAHSVGDVCSLGGGRWCAFAIFTTEHRGYARHRTNQQALPCNSGQAAQCNNTQCSTHTVLNLSTADATANSLSTGSQVGHTRHNFGTVGSNVVDEPHSAPAGTSMHPTCRGDVKLQQKQHGAHRPY